jgi:histone deacetylase 11
LESPNSNQDASHSPSPRIVYSRHYNFGFPGLQRLHPFDFRKYGRTWSALRKRFGPQLERYREKPYHPATHLELLEVHTPAYLEQLHNSKFLAGALEVPVLRKLPWWITDWLILRPMRWATLGTLMSSYLALKHKLVVNLGGGYHHASADDGHGFSIYADTAIAIEDLRQSRRLRDEDTVAYIDLDAHQGDGVCRRFANDPRVFIYDQYNSTIFPMDAEARRRVDCDVPLGPRCSDTEYLSALRSRLPMFLDSITRGGHVKLAIYNAGTDISIDDQLGGLAVSACGVLERDKFVLTELVNRRIPTMVLLSGGYSRDSYQMVAAMVAFVIETWGGALPREPGGG